METSCALATAWLLLNMPDVFAGLSPAVGLLAGGIAAISDNTIDGRLGSIDWTMMRTRLLKGKSFSRKQLHRDA